jgi:hypothetical protein
MIRRTYTEEPSDSELGEANTGEAQRVTENNHSAKVLIQFTRGYQKKSCPFRTAFIRYNKYKSCNYLPFSSSSAFPFGEVSYISAVATNTDE